MAWQFDSQRAVLVVVDLQEKLLPAIHDHAAILQRCSVLIRAARILEIPIVWTEQYVKGLGSTVEPIAEVLRGAAEPMEKMAFGCFGDENIACELAGLGRDQMILCGVEAHVCVLQTALAALGDGYAVFLAQDALGSRRPADRDAALRRLAQSGAVPATVEMLIMEGLKLAGTEKFKACLPLFKE